MINASDFFDKEKPKNVLRMAQKIEPIINSYKAWTDSPNLSKVVNIQDLRSSDYNLSPSQYIMNVFLNSHRDINEILSDIKNTESKRNAIDELLLNQLNLLNYHD